MVKQDDGKPAQVRVRVNYQGVEMPRQTAAGKGVSP